MMPFGAAAAVPAMMNAADVALTPDGQARLARAIQRRRAPTPAPAVVEAIVPGVAETPEHGPLPDPGDGHHNRRLVTEVLGVNAADLPGRDFYVSVDVADSTHPLFSFVPQNRDPYYMPDYHNAYYMLLAWEQNTPLMQTGPSGCGKSALCAWLAFIVSRPMVRVNLSGDVSSDVLFGMMTAANGGTQWNDGPVTEAVRYGAVLVCDEWDAMPPEIGLGMHWVMEDGGALYLKEKPGSSAERMVQRHDDFRLVANGNTAGQGDDGGKFSGTTAQSSAFIDRFGITLRVTYMGGDAETALLRRAVPDFDGQTLMHLVQFANAVRVAHEAGELSLSFSTRATLNVARMARTLGVRAAIDVTYANKLSHVQREVVTRLAERSYL